MKVLNTAITAAFLFSSAASHAADYRAICEQAPSLAKTLKTRVEISALACQISRIASETMDNEVFGLCMDSVNEVVEVFKEKHGSAPAPRQTKGDIFDFGSCY